jgi:hypothetical protein
VKANLLAKEMIMSEARTITSAAEAVGGEAR